MKFFSLASLSLLLALQTVCASPRQEAIGAKITKNEAEHIALKHHSGARVIAAKFESVEGRKVWSIEITQGEHRHMVAVDAVTGRISSDQLDPR